MDPNPADKIRLLLQLGRHAEAERAAREFIAAEPESAWGYYFLAQALLGLERFREALGASDRVLALAPSEWFAHTQRSAILQGVGRSAEAVEAAQAAMRLDHTEVTVHVRLASALAAADRDGEWGAVVSGARRQFPGDADVLYQAGLVALSREDVAGVAEVAERGLALDPANPGFHMLAGLADGHRAEHEAPEGPERQARYRAAEQRLAEAVRLNPTNAVLRRLRKNNARGSRETLMVKLLTGWMFGMALAALVLPAVLRAGAFPCWYFLALPLAVGLLGGACGAVCPEFSLVLPLGWLDVVSVPLLPEERRRGLAAWCVFLGATAAALLLPMLLVPAEHLTPDTRPTRRDDGFRLPPPGKGKTRPW
jgi:tetratricopeptide (TPR) repeat protein